MSIRQGWYDDPQRPGQVRWWDGTAWTGHTRDLTDTAAPSAPADAPAGPATSAGASAEASAASSDPRRSGHRPERTEVDASGGAAAASSGAASSGAASSGAARSGAVSAWPPPPATPTDPSRSNPTAGAATRVDATRAAGAAPAAGQRPMPTTPAWGGPPVRSASGRGNGARFALVAGIAVAAMVGLALVGALTTVVSDEAGDAQVVEDLVEVPTERVVTDPGGPMLVGTTRNGDVASGEVWSLDLVIAERGPVRIDVRGASGFDAVATVNRGDEVLQRNDDRGSPRAEQLGGDFLDPLLELDLDVGVYRVEVTGFGSSSGSFEIRIEQP